MRFFRPGLPALVGLLLLAASIGTLATALAGSGDTPVSIVRVAMIPITIGVALLLAALAVARRSRAGYLLGLTCATLMILGGVALIVVEIGYLGRGSLETAFASSFIVVTVMWIALWIAYALAMRRGRSAFAPLWVREDRGFAIVLAGLLVLTTAAYLSLGAVESAAAEAGVASRHEAEELVAGTTLAIEATDVTVMSTPKGSTVAVEDVRLQLTLHSAAAYELSAVPTLCLTDLATATDPGYKADTVCWGSTGPGIALASAFPSQSVAEGTATFAIDLGVSGSPCAFAPGRWNAELTLAPRIAASRDGGGNDATFRLVKTLDVRPPREPAPTDAPAAASDCIASVVSP